MSLLVLLGCSRSSSDGASDTAGTTVATAAESGRESSGGGSSHLATTGTTGGESGATGEDSASESSGTTGSDLPLPDPDPNWTRRGGSLSVDLQGWTNNPTLATDPGQGRIYAAWVQYRNPAVQERAGIRVSMWDGASWASLGDHINHDAPNVPWPDAYDPSLALLDGVPYLAWYEGGGYGWDQTRRSLVFVSHWNGSTWVSDGNASDPQGALNHWADDSAARNPVLTPVSGQLYALWIENQPDTNWRFDVVAAKRRTEGGWTSLEPIAVHVDDGGEYKIVDVAGVEVGGILFVAWTEISQRPGQDATSTVHVVRLIDDTWEAVGDVLNVEPTGLANYLAMAAASSMPYVAWQEKSAGGNYRIAVKHWDGQGWVSDADTLNVDPIAEAGRPALTGTQDRLWLAWAESLAGQPAQLRARILAGGQWTESSGSLNRSIADGSAGSPALGVLETTAYVAWVERDGPSATKQVYVAGNDMLGQPHEDSLSAYGADGPAVNPSPNTWEYVNAGGIVEGSVDVGDEGYSSLSYVSAVRRSVVFGKYHAGPVSFGENQNALLGYDSARNRWDIIEISEDAWSENLPGIGHDEGHVAVDSARGLYYSQGNLTLHGGTRYRSYVYDLVAGRGKRLIPVAEAATGVVAVGAFDAARNAPYMDGFMYDIADNAWLPLSGCPTTDFAGAAYDAVNDVIIQYGGSRYMEPSEDRTWRVDLDTRTCTEIAVAGPRPPVGMSHAAYDSQHGLVMVLAGDPAQLWAYDVSQNSWSNLHATPVGDLASAAGQNLTYDNDNDLLLFHNGTHLETLQAYRYVP